MRPTLVVFSGSPCRTFRPRSRAGASMLRRPSASRSQQIVVRPPRLEVFLERGRLERLNDFDDVDKARRPPAPAMAFRHSVSNSIQMDAQPASDGSPVRGLADVDQASILCVNRIASRLRTAWCPPPAFMRMGVNCKLREGGRPLGRTILLDKPQQLPAVRPNQQADQTSQACSQIDFNCAPVASLQPVHVAAMRTDCPPLLAAKVGVVSSTRGNDRRESHLPLSPRRGG